MNLARRACIWLALSVAWLAGAPVAAQETLSHGRFQDVALYRPQGEPRQFVLFLSGEKGWNGHLASLARELAARGALVAGIDTPRLVEALQAGGAACVFPDGDLENLAHFVQGYARLSTYHTPLLVGQSSGASLAKALAAQAPAGMFLGALALGPPLDARSGADQACAPAPARNPQDRVSPSPYVDLPAIGHDSAADARRLTQFLNAYERLAARAPRLPPPPASLADLPLVEVHARESGPVCAVLLSGDGGWAGLDKQVAAALAAQGVDVVGLDSLRYFWSKRTPEGLAKDIDRIVRFYAAQWRKTGVILVGYSQGADVLPFAINRLPPASKRLVTHAVLMGLGTRASFEFHVSNWVGSNDDGLLIRPEVDQLPPGKILCLYGADEQDSLCPQLSPAGVTARALPGGHHFDGDYARLAALILEHARS